MYGRTPRGQIAVRPDGSDPIVVPPVLIDPATVDGPVDVVMLAVKITKNDDACRWLALGRCVPQNGVEQVGPYCPQSTVIPTIVWFPAETHPDGWVRLRAGARLVLPANEAAASVAALIRGTGVMVELDADFTTAAWRKLLVNALAGLMVLTGRRASMFGRDPADIGTSILYDRQAGRRLEWDIRNGVIARKASRHEVPTPISDVVVPLLAAAGDGPG